MAFSDTSSIVVAGTPPAPPPPPPPPPAPPPPPPPEPKRVEVTQDKLNITEKIQFDVDKTTIKSESHGLLDEIVSVIKENSFIKKISIEGHTDSDGGDKYNLKLSDGRAKAVMAYLVEHGIDADRLTAKGFGESKPMADNATADGKEKNRRVEFLITEQKEITKTYEIDPKTGEKREVSEKKDKKEKDQ
jgi:outer membrane protein OmpA-like peptidoglycan-associated protein